MTTYYAAGFMFRDDTRRSVLLILKQKPVWQAGKFNGIGGKLEPGETAFDAMVREFREETGCATTVEDWREFCVTEHHQFDGVVHFFTSVWRPEMGEPRTVELEQVRWQDTDLRSPVIQNLLWLLPMAADQDNVTAYVVDRSVK